MTAAMLIPFASGTVALRPVLANVASLTPVAILPVSVATTTSSIYAAATTLIIHTNSRNLNSMLPYWINLYSMHPFSVHLQSLKSIYTM